MLSAQLTSTISPNLGYAQHMDGMLKDVSEIEWHYNNNDNLLMPTTALSHHFGCTLADSRIH